MQAIDLEKFRISEKELLNKLGERRMNKEKEFVNGLLVKAPHVNAPPFIKVKLSLKRTDLIDWLSAKTGDWINLDVKEAKSGKWYAEVDTWEPAKSTTVDEMPF